MLLNLKSLSYEDAEQTLDILTSKAVAKTYMLPDYSKREDALPLFHRLVELSQNKSRYVRGIYVNETLIGFLNDVEISAASIELGYVIHPDHWGKGYMTQALKLALSELFRLGYQEVVCGAFSHNAASIRVMEKAGMQKTDKTESIEYRDIAHQCVYYSIRKHKEEMP